MRRPPGLWVLLSAGVLWLSLQDAYGIRATSLIFGKSSTTTTTTEHGEASSASDEENATTTDAPAANGTDSNSTKPTLTGNPQIDYVWDPNLPKELNGYNLSDYPFYERVPEDIDFKCDGLHDGFYASVKHKCQVYHHCLFGVRYDFLCANYTAFDQTLFNCNFVSNVDCENSKKFWHRNDDLYISKTTTTAAPPPAYNFYTPPPLRSASYALVQPPAQLQQPTGGQQQQQPQGQVAPQVPVQAPPLFVSVDRRRSRPIGVGRRRPQYDYYDDEDYDDRPRTNRRKGRPRPRPVYYDDYDEDYEEERYDRRSSNRRRRPYDRRPLRRNKDRRSKYDYDDDEYDDEEDDFVLEKKAKDKRRKYLYDYDEEDDRYDKRRPQGRREDKPYRKQKKPLGDEEYEEYDDDKRNVKDDKRREVPEPNRFKKHPRLGQRRPPSEEHEDDLQRTEPKIERSRKSNKENTYKRPPDDSDRTVVKPLSGTIYDRPRMAPKINLPVPKNVANKYSYKTIATQTPSTKNRDYNAPTEAVTTTSTTSTTTTVRPADADGTESSTRGFKRSKLDNSREVLKRVMKRPKEDSQRYELTTTSTTTYAPYSERQSPIIRKFKRPFLPSRGGNPYSGRSLEPVGEKAIVPAEDVDDQEDSRTTDEDDYYDEIQVRKPDMKPVPVRVKSPIDDSIEKPGPIRIKVPIRVKMTDQTPPPTTTTSTTESNKINILDENYDVTINEALSPIIPNLPIRSYPTGFSDYNIRQKPTKYVILDPLTAGAPYYVK